MGHLFNISVKFDCESNQKNLRPSLLSLDESFGLTFDTLVIPYYKVDLWEGKIEIGFIEHDNEATFKELFESFITKIEDAGYKVINIDWDDLESWRW